MLAANQTQRIYGMAAALGMVISGSHDDALHDLVANLTGSNSVKALDDKGYKAVVSELAQRIKISQLEEPPAKVKRTKRYEERPGGITEGQQRKVWQLMYQLQGCDKEPHPASLGTRLSGIIKKEFDIDATERDPLRWVTYNQGTKLIDKLKQYVKSAEQKAMRGG